MSKYQPLTDHLAHLTGDSWRPTFLELERMLGFSLPRAARKPEWWANSENGHAAGWTAAGWEVDRANLDKEQVTFRRIGTTPEHTEADAAEKAIPEVKTVALGGHAVPVKKLALGAMIAAGAAAVAGAAFAMRRR
jgi:hypothetical protein